MYANEHIEDKIEQYTDFFNRYWQLLDQALVELGGEPDNPRLQGRIRSLVTMLQLATITLDYWKALRLKAVSDRPIYFAELASISV